MGVNSATITRRAALAFGLAQASTVRVRPVDAAAYNKNDFTAKVIRGASMPEAFYLGAQPTKRSKD